MKSIYLVAAAATAFVASAAMADTVSNTSLQNVNGVFGTSTATTTTTASGTRTTVVGPGPNAGANRAQGTPVFNNWYQANVGAGSTVGITTDYAQSGNGSAYFNSTTGDTGKADLQYYFGAGGALAPVALSSLTNFSFDIFRDGASTTNANFAPVLRFDILKNGAAAGALIFENVYNTNAPAPVNAWTTLSGDLNNGLLWTNNDLLGPSFAAGPGSTKTLAEWISDNAGSTLSVYGLELGIGSGWNNTFYGAADNVQVNFTGGRSVNSNFEVATAAAVPEPASWAMMITGFGLVGGMMRRRTITSVVGARKRQPA
jgi:hypothetical protein